MRLTLFIYCNLLVFWSMGQQRMVLVESFTQASCGPCASQNPAFDALIATNATKTVDIKYQVDWPGYDIMNLQNPLENEYRVDYYGIYGVPDRVIDGTNLYFTQAAIDNRYSIPSPVEISISSVINPDFTANVSVTITAPGIWDPTNSVLQLALVEKNITFASAPGGNGETEFKNVMRKMITNVSGSPLFNSNFSAPGGSQTYTFNNIPIPNYIYDLYQIRFIAWVQNNSTKEVHQAGASDPIILCDYLVVEAIDIQTIYSCAPNLTNASLVLKNLGNTYITSATVHYKLNNIGQTIPFSGSIAPNETTSLPLPNIFVTSGAHDLVAYITNVNGSVVNTKLGNKTTQFARITDNGTIGHFIQFFSSSSFPYNNYFLTSSTGDNWVRASLPTTQSLQYPFFLIRPGGTGEIFLAPIDMTTNTNNTMSFDVAYRQKQNENDRLEVLVSSDCGSTWTSVYDKAGSELATLPPSYSEYKIINNSHWRNEIVSLENFGSASKLIIKFRATSANGNNLFVDHITIGTQLALVEFEEIPATLFPNPSSQTTTVAFDAEGEYSVTLTDASGREIETISNTANGATQVEFNVEQLSAGYYRVNITSNGKMTTKALIIE